MSDYAARLSALRLLPGVVAPIHFQSSRCECFPFSLVEPGIPKGALTEISGIQGGGKTEAVLRLLSENHGIQVAWLEKGPLTLYPCAIAQQGVSLDRIFFVEMNEEDEVLWVAHQVLRSGLFGIVVVSCSLRPWAAIELRRLQLFAEQARASIILLSEVPTTQGAWPIALQLGVSRRPQRELLRIRLIKGQGERVAI